MEAPQDLSILNQDLELNSVTTHSPVSISVYDREAHLRECISALLQNPEARHTVLYIFSDAPKPGDEKKIECVRRYIRTIRGFAEVRVFHQDTNCYTLNMTQAREFPLQDFGRVIRMEDDIVVSPGFLNFMNTALDRFADDKRVFSVSGYSPNFCSSPPEVAFLTKDFSAWGYGTWRDRNLSECLDRRDYYSAMLRNSAALEAATKLHPLMLPMLRLVEQGKANPGDYKLSAYQFLSGKFSLKPNSNLVRNIGFDGSGMGGKSAKTFKFNTEHSHLKPTLPTELGYDPLTDEMLFRFYFPKNSSSTLQAQFRLHLLGLIPLGVYGRIRQYRSTLRKFFPT